MIILWITNIVFPEAERLLTGSGDLKSTGGWMLGSANALLKDSKEISLTVATVSPRVKKLTKLQGERITYYLLPYGNGNLKRNPDYEPFWKIVKQDVQPDVVHIHGTEFSHGLAYVDACGADNVVVSIQGMKSAYYYYYYGLTKWQILNNITLRDVLKGTPLRGQKKFKDQSRYEVELLQQVNHIIGRTSWDNARTWAINPRAHYHFCNETLRDTFYDCSIWNYERCCKHSIFVSQAGYPIKGFHQLLSAMPLVLRQYPDTVIRVAGEDITRNKGLLGIIHLSSYGKLLNRLIKENKLAGKVCFTGNLNADEMKAEYLRCNVFVLPSTIENSPNSIGEAQILGTPVIASFVGGVADMMKDDESHMYRFEEVEMLAKSICDVFESVKFPNLVSMDRAKERHSPNINCGALLRIYNEICQCNGNS